MDANKGSGTNFAFWLPGSAVILSLVVSTFALTRAPFLEPRPLGAQFHSETPIEARLWQDPFDALERFRKKLKDNKESDAGKECSPGFPTLTVSAPGTEPVVGERPEIMVALVEGGAYADEVEQRRRIRYAVLAGFKNSQMVPEDEQHIRCFFAPKDLSNKKTKEDAQSATTMEQEAIPYETFIANPFDPPLDINGKAHPTARTLLFWVKQDYLGAYPLQQLTALRGLLLDKLVASCGDAPECNMLPRTEVMKVIGPSTSAVLRNMYWDEHNNYADPAIEIYSPLATADYDTLKQGFDKDPKHPELTSPPKETMKLLRTVSDDGTMAKLLLGEMKLRRVDPVTGVQCSRGATQHIGTPCAPVVWADANRIALVSEWDSFYSRALIESFKSQVVEDAQIPEKDRAVVDKWILRFSYLRGLDGRLPEEAAKADKATAADASKSNPDDGKLDLGSLEKSDGNSQLDYLRRLADHIMREDEAYRREGKSGIGAIGVLGEDTYDKLLVLQALKSQMPSKVFFSTDLDARMLERGQAQTTRNLVLAAPYGLTLTRALQQDVPPFRDSLQSSVFISVLAAQAPQRFEEKRAKFDYSKSELLSPGIYEVGISGFIPLASQFTAARPEDCAAPVRTQSARGVRPHDIMALRCLQDPSPPPYPEPSKSIRAQFDQSQSFFLARPLLIILLIVGIFLGWRLIDQPSRYYRGVPLALYVVAGFSAIAAAHTWRVGFMWFTFVLILLGIICTGLIRRDDRKANVMPAMANRGLFDSSAWYLAVPLVVFVLALLLAYQNREVLTDEGLGEPMFLFEGISAWPTVALRLLAALISISALGWGWRNLRVNRQEIESSFHLGAYMGKYPMTLWGQFPRFLPHKTRRTLREWRRALGSCLFLILFPLSTLSLEWTRHQKLVAPPVEFAEDQRTIIFVTRFWREHCVCGTFGARMLRAVLATWIFIVITSVLYVFWPMEGTPVRGESPIWLLSWLLPTVLFQFLVFWVVDANLLLTRFIRHLSEHYAIWPKTLRREHEKIFGTGLHPCIDDWVDILLIAKRSAAVNRLIYAPTVVMLILLASRSSVFDNWQTPPSLVITFLLTALLLLVSALSLRRAAEKARSAALQRIDNYLLKAPADEVGYEKFKIIRERIAALNTGAFSRYSEEPLVRALLLSLTGIGGSVLVDALNFAKF
ncbi:hypothetical protein [Pseudomonas sp. NA-150]|uniref:hypothetical protein n=1 Tax=Pseudomonas sp. NA-150 TaxID=3367525 RepID=UPI0037CB1CB6